MSETKRRNKSEAPGEDDFQPKPNRQTRVTLTKDVSSKYRKIMPRDQGERPGGQGAPKRKRPQDEGSAPPRRGRRGEAPKFDRTAGRSGEERPPFGERPPARGRRADSPRPGEDRPRFGERSPMRGRRGDAPKDRPRFGDRPRLSDRPNFGGRSAPRRNDDERGLEMKAIVNRELPEAARQVKEAQELILNTATEMLALTESLAEAHGLLDQALSQAADEYQLLGDVLNPAREHLERSRSTLLKLMEKMSFQDLAGQRLAKVENFCAALTQVLGRAASRAPARRPTDQPREKYEPRKGSAPRDRERGGSAGGSRLKGPQAAGEGLDQTTIDRLLDDL